MRLLCHCGQFARELQPKPSKSSARSPHLPPARPPHQSSHTNPLLSSPVAAQFNARHSIQYVVRGEQTQLKCQAKGDWPIALHWFRNRNRLEPINLQESAAPAGLRSVLSSSSASLLLKADSGQPLASSLLAEAQARAQGLPSSKSVLERLNAPARGQTLGARDDQGRQAQQPVQQQQQQGGLLMQRYSLASVEFALNQANLEAATLEKLPSHHEQSGAGQSSSSSSNNNHNYNNVIQNNEPNLQQPIVIQVNSVLSISQVERQDTSTFKCFAANYYGFDERTIQLIVQEIPDKIEELSVLEVSSRSITLAWLVPFDGNAPITSYLVQHKWAQAAQPAAPGQQQALVPSASNPSLPPEALSPLGWFNLTLPANRGGALMEANYSLISTNQPLTGSASSILPSATSGHSLSQASPTAALTPSGGKSLARVTISSLKPMTSYWFRVAAENKLGLAQMSTLLEGSTVEEAPGAAPGKLRATAQSSSSILVSWTRLSEGEVFGPVHGYYVAYRPLQADSAGSDTAGANKSSPLTESGQQAVTNIYKTIQHDDKLTKFDALLTGLKRSTKYMISVQAFNARGTGPSTEAIVVRTLEMDPPRQVKLFVKQSTNCSIELEWRPLSQAAAMQQFLLQQRPLNTSSNQGAKSSSILPLAMPLEQSRVAHSDDPPVRRHQQQQQQADTADVVEYYSLYKAELNERPQWQEVRLPGHASGHLVENLACGTRYQFYMMGVNKIGVGDQSDILDTKTAGGLPLAPERQLTFDVINTTCYVIRLDHWQDNGCPLREFNVRFKPEGAREWKQLAHFDFGASDLGNQKLRFDENKRVMRRRELNIGENNSTKAWHLLPFRSEDLAPLGKRRTKRFAQIDKEDSYTFPMEDDESLFDYSVAESSLANSDSSSLGDLSSLDYVVESSIGDSGSSGQTNSSLTQSPEQDKQLISLLRDSMLPTFETGEMTQAQLYQPKGTESGDSLAQRWEASNLVENPNPDSRTFASRAAAYGSEQQVDNEQGSSRTTLAARSSSPSSQDWRRVRLCNLAENIHYVIQIEAINSVGETEAELRLLTSQEGLEYDQEIKRQVVGRLGGDRMAQSVAMSDRLSLFALNQWPVLVPITLTITLMTVIVIAALLLKRSNQAGSSSTATTTTTSSTHHCQNYLDRNNIGHHGGTFRKGAPSAMTEVTVGSDHAPESQLMDSYALGDSKLVENFHPPNGLMPIYQSQKSTLNETAYGIGCLNQRYGGGFVASNANDTNGSSSSPATTAQTVSVNSSSGIPGTHFNMQVYKRPDNQSDGHLRGRSVYLCTASKDDTFVPEPQEQAVFYGMATNSLQKQPDRTSHYQQEEPLESHVNNYSINQHLFQQQNDLYQPVQLDQSRLSEIGMDQSNGKQLDSCFLTLVEEVARANEAISQQQAKLSVQTANKQQDLSGPNCLLAHCNQYDCSTNKFQTNVDQPNQATNYASVNILNTGEVSKQVGEQGDSRTANGPMFDQEYATIRRTFPTAFRYLTLQQNSHRHQDNPTCSSHFRSQLSQQNATVCNQRHSLDDEVVLVQQLNKQHEASAYQGELGPNSAHFASTNLAALNLLTTNPATLAQQTESSLEDNR